MTYEFDDDLSAHLKYETEAYNFDRNEFKPTSQYFIKKPVSKRIAIYTDGSCKPNPGAGGWAAVIHGNYKTVLQGSELYTTNNRMEMLAVICALESIEHTTHVSMYTDSKYVVDGITRWIRGWERKGWPDYIKNKDLWKRMDKATKRHRSVKWILVRGHSNNYGNNEADELATEARIKQLIYTRGKRAIEPQVGTLDKLRMKSDAALIQRKLKEEEEWQAAIKAYDERIKGRQGQYAA